MAEIQQKETGKKKKGAQKKMDIHVDFTPMVDMNMLLISFFMLCTTMIKSQTLNISLPSNEKKENLAKTNEAKDSEAITIYLTTDYDEKGKAARNSVFYYFGRPYMEIDEATGLILDPPADSEITGVLEGLEFDVNEKGGKQAIRKILHDRNKDVIEKIDEVKKEKQATGSKMTDEEFNARIREISKDSTLTRPVVIIKARPDASWESVITALDEMQINAISRYQLENFAMDDSILLNDYFRKNPDFGKPFLNANPNAEQQPQ